MIKNIINEIKSAFKSKITFWYFIGIVAAVLLANVAVLAFRVIYGANEGTYAYNLMEYATWCFIIPYYTCVVIADIVFGKEYPNPNIRNGNTSGLNRVQIYLSKLIAGFVLALVLALTTAVVLIVVTSLFQIKDGLLTWYSITDFFGKFAIAIPLWFAGLSFGQMFLFINKKKKIAYIEFFGLTLVLPRLIMFFAAEPFMWAFFRLIRTYTLTQNFSLIPYLADPARNVPLTIALGIIYGIIAAVVGCVYYSKKKFD